MIDTILKISAAISAVGVICGCLYKVWQLFCKLKDTVDELKDTLKDLKQHDHDNYMSLLRLTIMSNEMPIGERIVAGQKYLEEGGNGEVKHFLEEKFDLASPIGTNSHYK